MSQLDPNLSILLRFALWGAVSGALFAWLRHAITPTWVRGLFESEKEPSIRLVLAAVVTVFALCMVAAGRVNEMQLEALFTFVGTLLLIGSARIAATAFAKRPPAPPVQVTAKKAEMSAEGDINYTEAPKEPL